MRLLLVEDDPALATTAAAYLRRVGFAVDVAADGERALLESARTRYDPVVLDRTRVTLWYAASVGAVLVGAALVFRLAFAESLPAEFDRALADSAALARSFLALEVAEYGSAEPLDPRHAPGWRVRVIASTDPVTRPLHRVDALALLGIPLGASVAGRVGWWLAGRTLRPVAEMAEAIERVSPGTRPARPAQASPIAAAVRAEPVGP